MKSLKKFIWEEMSKKGYVLDCELAKFLRREPNYGVAEEYKREYLKYNHDKEFFGEKINKNTKLEHFGRRYQISINGENEWYRISKIYYKELEEIL